MEDDKIYFMPGDMVTIRQDLPNKPTMLVIRKETANFKSDDNFLIGIRCRWFTNDGYLQEAVFNTKDIIKL